MARLSPVDTTQDTIPDLTAITPARLGGTPLAHAIALYRERLREPGKPPSAFNSQI